MFEIIDDPCWKKTKKVLTFADHRISGLKNFAYWELDHAISPTPMHYHSDIIEFHCLVKGRRLCNVKNDRPLTVYGNELFMTFPFELHSSGTFAQEPVKFYAFQIDISNSAHLLNLNSDSSYTLYCHLKALTHRHLKLTPFHLTLLKKAFSNLSSSDRTLCYIGAQYLVCFLFALDELIPVTPTHFTIDISIRKCLTYINDHYCESIELEDLAKISSLSLSYFKSKFKEQVGIPPYEYINLKKIEHAKLDLETTDLSITQIAFKLGFSSSSYFCTVFKKFLSLSPKDYRNLYKNNQNISG